MINNVYLSRDESNIIKGILILLIVLGHNHFLVEGEYVGIQNQLYKFHVIGFFILPFFYNIKAELDRHHLQTVIVRNWVPYLWILVLCYLVSGIHFGTFDIGFNHIKAVIMGTQGPIKRCFHFVFPWFLPTYCTFYIIYLFALRYRLLHGLMILASLMTWGCTWTEFYVFKNSLPLGVGLAVGYYAYGWLASYLNKLSVYMKYIGAVLFVAVNVLQMFNIHVPAGNILLKPCFILFLLAIMPLLNFEWLKVIGKNSLGIYLFNVFVIDIFCILLPHNLCSGALIFLLSVVIPLGISIMINKVDFARKVLFPKNITELKSFFKS